MPTQVAFAYACACAVALALLAIPFWLLAGVPEVPGLVILGGLAAVAGVGLGLAVRAGLRQAKGAAPAAALNGALLALATSILWMWGRYLAEPPCPTC